MKHKTKKRIFTTIGIIAIILLFIFGVWGFFHYIVSKQANPPAFISAISSLMIALLTLVYVITTNRQLRAMRAQLFEMKRSREISTQPLPLVVLKDMYLEKPRVYYSPPEKECAGISRYILECSVSNFGSSPAVCVHMCACIHIG
ncbi:MAG: hypothetical protein OEW70_03475, partial [candidate division WOR-3 bacterium]|nr:hypothetical protein [candidate division WOR-3 bacterium]